MRWKATGSHVASLSDVVSAVSVFLAGHQCGARSFYRPVVTLHLIPGITFVCFQSFSGIYLHCHCTEIPDYCT
jgi:hypothetical protein